jgi:hypothetical protein
MDPIVWGPKLWFVIHTFALNYPDNPTYEDRRVMEEFFNNLKYSIPCHKCRIHYRQNLQNNPIISYLDNKQSLFKYTVDLHNLVNKSLGKKIYSYDEVTSIYKNHYNPSAVKAEQPGFFKRWFNKTYVIYSAVTLVLLTIIIVYLKRKFPRRLIKIN